MEIPLTTGCFGIKSLNLATANTFSRQMYDKPVRNKFTSEKIIAGVEVRVVPAAFYVRP
jgi:hypothetical protein